MATMASRVPSKIWLPYTTLVLTAALVAVASFLPNTRLWGVNHLAHHAVPVRIFLLLLIALSFLPVLARGAYRVISRLGEGLRGLRHRRAVMVSTVLVTLTLLSGLSSRTYLLGDGVYVVNNMRAAANNDISPSYYAEHVTPSEHVYPGTDLLNFTASWIVRKITGADAPTGVSLLASIIGALFVLVLLLFACQTRERTMWPLLAVLFVLGSGAILVFFGYIENYAPLLLLGLVYLLASYRTLTRGGSLLLPLSLLVFGTMMHIQMLLLVPSLVFLVLWVAWLRNHISHTRPTVAAISTVTAGAVLLLIRIPSVRDSFLDISGPYGVLTPIHLIDVFNELFLLFPAFLILFASGAVSQSGGKNSPAAFAACVTLPSALFLLLFRPQLGMARDWDLFAFTAVGLALPAVLALRRFVHADRWRAHHPTILMPGLSLTLILAVAWVTLNASATLSVARYKSILQFDQTNAGYAYESLSMYYQDMNDYDGQVDALYNAYTLSGNPRLLLKLSLLRSEHGDTLSAVMGLKEVLEVSPDNDTARLHYMSILMARGQIADVIDVARTGMEISEEEPLYPYYVGRALIAQGQIREGVRYFQLCRRLNPSREILREIDRLTVELQRRHQ